MFSSLRHCRSCGSWVSCCFQKCSFSWSISSSSLCLSTHCCSLSSRWSESSDSSMFYKPRISRLASGLLNAVCSPTPRFSPSSFFLLPFLPRLIMSVHECYIHKCYIKDTADQRLIKPLCLQMLQTKIKFVYSSVSSRKRKKQIQNSSKNMGAFTNKVDVHQSRKDGCNLLGKQRRVVEFLGEGSFGQVLKCSNFETGTMEAVKVMKSCTDVIEIAKHEIQILKQLRRLDPNTSHVVRFNSFFFNMEDICLSFEFLDVDLDTYISEMSPCKTGLPLPEVRHITEQLVTALHHLKTIGLIHMDMKPENVMIVDRHEKPLQVKYSWIQQEHATGLDLFMDLIKNMLQVDPNQRITPVEALQHPVKKKVMPPQINKITIQKAVLKRS
uniref:Protein kinase domain-containing protein n=1 Tax=Takifugu rubripes TaxID=31033 RepID=A0A674PPD2_TAKRU